MRLLKFENDDALDSKTLFQGAKLSLKNGLQRKTSFKDR